MSVLADCTRATLLHRGGEAQIFRVWVGNKSYVLKWYAEGCKFDAAVSEVLLHNRIDGIYHLMESGEKQGRPFLVYDFVEGVDSSQLTPMPAVEAVASLRKLVATLKRLSERGVHHGDLNPANVLFGSEGLVTLIDCGIVGPGALAYAAPERLRGKPANEKSDAYSLGMLLYYWITGEALVKASSFDEFVDKAAAIDSVDVTSNLYGMMDRLVASRALRGVEDLAKLEPLWKGLFCENPEDRVEDLDELDELLDIALDGLGGNGVGFAKTHEKFVYDIVQKIGTNGNEGPENAQILLEFASERKTKRNKKSLFAIIFIVALLLTVLGMVLQSNGTSVDETGALMLQKSRALNADGVPNIDEKLDSAVMGVDSLILKSLPVPQIGESE